LGDDEYDGCVLVGGGDQSDHKSEIEFDCNAAIEEELEAELLNGYCSDEAGDRSYSKKI